MGCRIDCGDPPIKLSVQNGEMDAVVKVLHSWWLKHWHLSEDSIRFAVDKKLDVINQMEFEDWVKAVRLLAIRHHLYPDCE